MTGIFKINKLWQFLTAAGAVVVLLCAQFWAASWANDGVAGPGLIIPLALLPALCFLAAAALVKYDLRVDWPLVVAVLILAGIGTVVGWRLSPSELGFWKILLKRAAGLAAFALAAVYFSRKENLLNLLRRYFLIAAAAMALSLLFGLFLTITDKGVFFYKRVPWDFFKVMLTIVFAGYLADYSAELSKTWYGFPRLKGYIWGPLILLWAIPLAGILLLHDFGQVLIYGILIIALLFMATGRLFYPVSVACMTAVGTVFILNYPAFVPAIILKRFDLWSNIWQPEITDAWWGKFYHTANMLFTVDCGGLLGSGFGWGYPGLVYSMENDCVYTGLVEEGGWVLGMAVLALYLVIILRGFAIAARARNSFLKMLASGFVLIFSLQVLLNIGGVLNMIPMTGISLPLLSASGTSLVTNLAMMGFLVAINHVQKTEEAPEVKPKT